MSALILAAATVQVKHSEGFDKVSSCCSSNGTYGPYIDHKHCYCFKNLKQYLVNTAIQKKNDCTFQVLMIKVFIFVCI